MEHRGTERPSEDLNPGRPPMEFMMDPEWERSPTKPPPGSGGTLFGLRGHQLTRLGVVLIAIGILFFMSFPLAIFLSIPSEPFGMPNPRLPFGAWFLAFIGVFLLGFDGTALRYGMIRPVSRYVATEVAPGLEYGAETIGRGLAEGLRGGGLPRPLGGQPSVPAVRVKCRSCGYLDTEDATYCSKCGQPL